MRRRQQDLRTYHARNMRPARPKRDRQLSNAVIQHGDAAISQATNAANRLASTKVSVDEFNRQNQYAYRQAKKQAEAQKIGAIISLASAGIGMAVGAYAANVAANTAGTAAGVQALSAGVSEGTSAALAASASSATSLPAALAKGAYTGLQIGALARPALTYLAQGGKNPGLALGGAALTAGVGLLPFALEKFGGYK